MNSSTRSTRLIGPAVALLLTPSIAPAVDWAFQPRIETGFQLYEFEQGAVVSTTQEQAFLRFAEAQGSEILPTETVTQGQTTTQTVTVSSKRFDDALWTLAGGFTVFADRFFLDVSAQGGFNGSDSDDLTETFNLPTTAFQTGEQQANRARSDADLEREEYSLSLGYAVTDGFSVYGGWKWAKTRFEENRNGTISIEQEWLDPFGLLLGGNINWVRYDGTFQDKVEYDFEQSGPFLGAAYGWTFDGGGYLNGSLVANFAVAFLDGDFKDVKRTSLATTIDSVTVGGGGGFEPSPGDIAVATERFNETASLPFFDGDTIGATFGVTWKGETNVKNLAYLLGISAYSYNFDADNRASVTGGDVTETLINFRAGIAYLF